MRAIVDSVSFKGTPVVVLRGPGVVGRCRWHGSPPVPGRVVDFELDVEGAVSLVHGNADAGETDGVGETVLVVSGVIVAVEPDGVVVLECAEGGLLQFDDSEWPPHLSPRVGATVVLSLPDACAYPTDV